MPSFPKRVEFHEEGPREGFQMDQNIYPIEQRAALIDALSDAGIPQIQVGSMVDPVKVPSMADTDELFRMIKKKKDIRYTVLWLNEHGFHRALALPDVTLQGYLYFYASDALARRNNNRSAEQMRLDQLKFVKLYEKHGVPMAVASIMCAFGCNFEGDIPVDKVVSFLPWIREITVGRGHDMPAIMLADTMGWANPEQVKRTIGAVRELEPDVRIAMHIHDTRGLGLANLHAALEMGADLFDTSVAGLGGCPFANHKNSRTAGNVCTEDAVFLCHELGIETGIDLDKMIEAALVAESIFGRPLSGKVMHSGNLPRLPKVA